MQVINVCFRTHIDLFLSLRETLNCVFYFLNSVFYVVLVFSSLTNDLDEKYFINKLALVFIVIVEIA